MYRNIREKGQQEYKKLFKEERNDRPTDTALDAMTIEHVFANVWSRPQLSTIERSMITVAILTALGRDSELKSHIRGALRAGISLEKINEIMLHTSHYAGWPAGHNGKRIAHDVFKEEKFQNASYKRIVFCDFDGTITDEDTFIKMFSEREETKDIAEEVRDQIQNKEIPIKEGIGRLLGKIPFSKQEEIINYACSQKGRIREDFVEFLEFLKKREIPLIIISGGLTEMIKATLGDIFNRIHKVYAANMGRTGEFIRARSDYEGMSELISKIKIMDLYEYEESIFIGDSITDENAAKWGKNSMVFARDKLAEILSDCDYVEWSCFKEIEEKLKNHWS